MHVANDDHSRYASVSIMEDEKAESVTRNLIETYQQYAAHGIHIRAVADLVEPMFLHGII